MPGSIEEVVDPIGEHMLPVHPEPEARHGDAELRGGDVAVLLQRIPEHRLHEFGEPVALGREVVDRGFRCTDDGKLRGHEECVEKNQPGDDEERDHDSRASDRGFRRTPLNSSATPPSNSPTTSSSVTSPSTPPSSDATNA